MSLQRTKKWEHLSAILWDVHVKNYSFATRERQREKNLGPQILLDGKLDIRPLRCGAMYSRLRFDFMEM